jgi:hypothetical protein
VKEKVLPTSLKLGLVGPGLWGFKIADVLRSQGNEIAYHVRGNGRCPCGTKSVPGMGELVTMADLFHAANAKAIDAIVCTAPPETTLDVYEVCKTLAIPTLLTKPLKLYELGEQVPLVPTVVDYVRLWSPHYHRIKQETQRLKIAHVTADFYDLGPYRGYPGLWDYGPHAVAFLYDLLGDGGLHLSSVKKTERDGGDYWVVEGVLNGVAFDMAIGNASEEASSKKLIVRTIDGLSYTYEEFGPNVICRMPSKHVIDEKPQALQIFVKSFVENVKSKHVNLYTLWLSTKISNFLKRVEEWS